MSFYLRNRNRLVTYHHGRYVQVYERNRRLVDQAKQGECRDCGGHYPPECMDFDHLPGHTKIRSISSLMTASTSKITAEMAKCELVCSNCHRIRTRNRLVA